MGWQNTAPAADPRRGRGGVAPSSPRGALVELLTSYRLDPVAAFIIFPAGRRPSQEARVFSDDLERAIPSSNDSWIGRALAAVAARFVRPEAKSSSPASAKRMQAQTLVRGVLGRACRAADPPYSKNRYAP